MSHLTRRSFLAGAAAIPFTLWLEKYGWAQPTTPRIRFDARSTQGQAMLKIYAQAVNKMKTATAEGDPRSWVFQWYTHAVKSSTTKSAEIARIYPSPSAFRSLAVDMWNTCQAHGPTDNENFFLPWHRMFVFFFESIIRTVSGNSTFTLPYWNYSVTGTNHGVMPSQFRMASDPTFKSLFVSKRNSGVNSGQPIDQGQPPGVLSPAGSLRECSYAPQGGRQGFCMNLDQNLHGTIHVLVGNGQNMGSVPWAAGDPIFWMHHCNIDRLWASWNAGGRKNLATSSFLAKTFVFAAANGTKVVAKVQDFLDIAKLGYRYDRLESVPSCPPTSLTGEEAEVSPRSRARMQAPVALGAAPARVALEPAAELGGEEVSLPDRVKSLPPKHRLYLVVRKLRAHAQPNVLYNVYLDLPSGTAPAQGQAYWVGTVHFFDAVGHGGHDQNPAAEAGERDNKFFSFDITDVAKRLQSQGRLGAKPTLTIVPAGQPAAEAKPVVGEMTLVEQ
ncbi:MAG TPA: tyrosinase family protein [Thermoanaerobaculia bacterium]|jgi:tyrosinase